MMERKYQGSAHHMLQYFRWLALQLGHTPVYEQQTLFHHQNQFARYVGRLDVAAEKADLIPNSSQQRNSLPEGFVVDYAHLLQVKDEEFFDRPDEERKKPWEEGYSPIIYPELE